MGCQLGKVLVCSNDSSAPGATVEDGGGGGDLPLPEPPPPAALDPRLPLTAREKFRITKSWKGISRAMEPTGVNMFLALFQTHGELLDFFTKFGDLKSRDSQAESMELSQHAETVMAAIDEGIKAMDNVDFLLDLLHQIGASHTKIKGFKKDYFWKIQDPFLDAVKLTLGERYTEDMDRIYRTTIKFLIETVVEGYDLAEGAKNENNTPTTDQKELDKKMEAIRHYSTPSPEREVVNKNNVNNTVNNKDGKCQIAKG
ncbi:unnamed protein product, partial [Meganyctiphanes norvegica]